MASLGQNVNRGKIKSDSALRNRWRHTRLRLVVDVHDATHNNRSILENQNEFAVTHLEEEIQFVCEIYRTICDCAILHSEYGRCDNHSLLTQNPCVVHIAPGRYVLSGNAHRTNRHQHGNQREFHSAQIVSLLQEQRNK